MEKDASSENRIGNRNNPSRPTGTYLVVLKTPRGWLFTCAYLTWTFRIGKLNIQPWEGFHLQRCVCVSEKVCVYECCMCDVCELVGVCARVCLCECVWVCVWMGVGGCGCTCVCVCVCVCVRACVCVCMCVASIHGTGMEWTDYCSMATEGSNVV